MLLIDCPWCGPRAEPEFSYGGEAHIVRPPRPDALSDAQWADYLFMRTNPKGLHREQWCHRHGCGQWFNVERDTVTYRILRTYLGQPPDAPAARDPAAAPAQGPGSDPTPVPGSRPRA